MPRHPDPVAPPLTDNALVLRAQDGDAQCFEELVRRYHGRVFAQCVSIMRSEADALDATQDAFLNAFRKLHTFRGDASFSSWLYRVAHNACLMILRKRRRRPEVPLVLTSRDNEDNAERQLEDPGPLPGDLLADDQLRRAIDLAVATLSDSYREVFWLADIQGLSMREIADTLELTVPNVKTRLHRARLKLRDRLAQHAEERALAA